MGRKTQPRQGAVNKALQRGRKIGKQALIEAVMEQVNKSLAEFRSATISDYERLLGAVAQISQNQHVLGQSHQEIDDQVAVLIRLIFIRQNQLIELQNQIYAHAIEQIPEESRPKDPEAHKIPMLTFEEVQQLFGEYMEFKKRPDFREYFRAWYTGQDLSKLPPLPEVKEQNEESSAPEEAIPEGAQVFGGDYGESTNGNGAEEDVDSGAEQESELEDSLPELRQLEDSEEDFAGDNHPGSLVPPL